ncbi:MAG: hypothetical protein DRP12_00210 [Candidatus Aenigmatarchaeota archaeon]|nr:MAG: hypothetical protein DRP12_00210 [Candidatus Aenigmarchaeota archaeon]
MDLERFDFEEENYIINTTVDFRDILFEFKVNTKTRKHVLVEEDSVFNELFEFFEKNKDKKIILESAICDYSYLDIRTSEQSFSLQAVKYKIQSFEKYIAAIYFLNRHRKKYNIEIRVEPGDIKLKLNNEEIIEHTNFIEYRDYVFVDYKDFSIYHLIALESAIEYALEKNKKLIVLAKSDFGQPCKWCYELRIVQLSRRKLLSILKAIKQLDRKLENSRKSSRDGGMRRNGWRKG